MPNLRKRISKGALYHSLSAGFPHLWIRPRNARRVRAALKIRVIAYASRQQVLDLQSIRGGGLLRTMWPSSEATTAGMF
jgi:hypothetical protein